MLCIQWIFYGWEILWEDIIIINRRLGKCHFRNDWHTAYVSLNYENHVKFRESATWSMATLPRGNRSDINGKQWNANANRLNNTHTQDYSRWTSRFLNNN